MYVAALPDICGRLAGHTSPCHLTRRCRIAPTQCHPARSRRIHAYRCAVPGVDPATPLRFAQDDGFGAPRDVPRPLPTYRGLSRRTAASPEAPRLSWRTAASPDVPQPLL